MSQPSIPIVFDRARLRKRRDAAAPAFSDFDFLKVRAAEDIAERLADVSRRFPLALDLDCHDGAAARAVLATGQVDRVVATDLSHEMAVRASGEGIDAIVGDAEALPFSDGAFDLIVSALGLHWVNDLPGALVQARRALKPDGLFLAALFGAGTLAELREALLIAETELTGGAGPRVSPLPGLQDAAGLLQRAGYALPVADIDAVTVRYDTPFHLLADLKGMGERSAFAAPAGRGLSRRLLARMAEVYAERFSDPDGRLRATFQVIHLSGWAPAPGQPAPLRPGSGRASLAEAVKKAGSGG